MRLVGRRRPVPDRPLQVARFQVIRLQDRDVRQVTIVPLIVETVSDNEFVGDLEPDMVGRPGDLPPGRFPQQHNRDDLARTAAREFLAQCGEGLAGIEDIV